MKLLNQRKEVHVSYSTVVDMMRMLVQDRNICEVSDVDLPEGVIVESVSLDCARGTFVVTVKHESFNVIPTGDDLPEIEVSRCLRGDEWGRLHLFAVPN